MFQIKNHAKLKKKNQSHKDNALFDKTVDKTRP